MKKVISLLLSLCLILTLTACKSKEEVDTANRNDNIEVSSKKISGNITGTSLFSEGLAFVCTNGNREKAYCIDTKGNIIFEVDAKMTPLLGVEDTQYQFKNGYVIIDGKIYDKKGNITTPEDVGVTNFYDIGFKDGYILADIVSLSYDGSNKKLGVMDMTFKWIVEPSEDIYSAVKESVESLKYTVLDNFYTNDHVYFANNDCFLNLKTGNIVNELTFEAPSSTWYKSDERKMFFDYNDKPMLDVNKHSNIILSSHFVNGKMPVAFKNIEEQKFFFTLIDEKGDILFEPIYSENLGYMNFFEFDGEYIIVNAALGTPEPIQFICYNMEGEIVGEFNTSSLTGPNYDCGINDGIICVSSGSMPDYTCHFYNTDFTPLF